MPCEEVQKKIEAYADKELTLSDQRALEEHLAHCSRCTAMLNNLRTLSTSIRKIGYAKAPVSLRRKIKSGLKEVTGEEVTAFTWRHLLGAGFGSALMASLLAWFAMTFTGWPPLQFQSADEIVAAHVRSMMVTHITDVHSSDRHTVKPWFNGKLDFSPTVVDLQEHAYPLVGGRLDYLQKQTVAALVYKHRSHIINVFIRRNDSNAHTASMLYTQQQGYNLIRWTQDGLDYSLISDLNEKELRHMARLLERQHPRKCGEKPWPPKV